MRLLFDARVIQPHFPGIGRYARSLLEALVRESPDLEVTVLGTEGWQPLQLPGVRRIDAPPVFSAAAQLWGPWLGKNSGAELFHAPYYLYPYAMPLPTIVTLHDLIPLDYPHMIPEGVGRWLYRPLNLLGARRAAHVVTDSLAGREAVRWHLRLPERKVSVIHPAPDPFFTPDLTVAKESYFFSVISNKPHKNGARLIRAFAATDPQTHRRRLLLAGPHDPDWPSLQVSAEEAGVAGWIEVVGAISDTELREHYRRCYAFVFPSFAEGFGLPVLEAMSCGAPTLVADRAPMRDLVGDAALCFDPFDERSITATLCTLLDSPALRAQLSTRAVARAARFNWTKSAREMLALYDRVLSSR
jgi:glycosyltransferase involved in cell wall biosynthesis